eukprot:TRINITY_DN7377_c0_g3_i3.p1 TRINITY_DN7377_c0_g3~~TRINITY_DN7377_c0_g3_i3.p1  ORF type:complete len:370 (+),score=52.81 TRINITY_DN7377_c0_g3_i3:50-1159(+)
MHRFTETDDWNRGDPYEPEYRTGGGQSSYAWAVGLAIIAFMILAIGCIIMGVVVMNMNRRLKAVESQNERFKVAIQNLENRPVPAPTPSRNGGSDTNAVSALQGEVNSIRSDINDVKESVASVKSQIGDIKSLANKAHKDAKDAKESVTPFKTDIQTAKKDASTAKTEVQAAVTEAKAAKTEAQAAKSATESVKTDLNTVKTDVTAIKTDIKKVKEDVAKKANATPGNQLFDVRKVFDVKPVSKSLVAKAGFQKGKLTIDVGKEIPDLPAEVKVLLVKTLVIAHGIEATTPDKPFSTIKISSSAEGKNYAFVVPAVFNQDIATKSTSFDSDSIYLPFSKSSPKILVDLPPVANPAADNLFALIVVGYIV